MKIVIAMFPNVDTPEPGRLGRMIEDRGLESLWFTTFDPFVAMTAAAAATNRLKIGTGCVVPQREPIQRQSRSPPSTYLPADE